MAEEDGLLAVGGDLAPRRLISAYAQGIFPWYTESTPILWWSPEPRCVLFPDELHTPRSLKKILNSDRFSFTLDTVFEQVIKNCAESKNRGGDGTWLVPEMIDAYTNLHESGLAHSAETWLDGELVGGLYGVSLGSAFFGESMFYKVPDASKFALVRMVEILAIAGCTIIDCQQETPNLLRFGARGISREEFMSLLENALAKDTWQGNWQFGIKSI